MLGTAVVQNARVTGSSMVINRSKSLSLSYIFIAAVIGFGLQYYCGGYFDSIYNYYKLKTLISENLEGSLRPFSETNYYGLSANQDLEKQVSYINKIMALREDHNEALRLLKWVAQREENKIVAHAILHDMVIYGIKNSEASSNVTLECTRLLNELRKSELGPFGSDRSK